MSAKWRRRKEQPKRSRFLKALKKSEYGKTRQTFQITNSKNKKCPPFYMRVPKVYREGKLREPRPLIDIVEENDEVIVVAELAGFNKENIKIHAKNLSLTLSAETLNRKYYKSLNLPMEVIPDSMRTTYKNGVLEIRLKKARGKETVDKLAGLRNAT